MKLAKFDKTWIGVVCIFILYSLITLSQWRKYEWNYTSMVHFGLEFAEWNRSQTPYGAIVEKGTPGDLGAGYDGQIFYYYSRTVSSLSNVWPNGFDESYRAPRIGYPFLIGLFGFVSQEAAIFGMYFWNISLFILSFILLRKILGENYSYLSWFYIFSPFSLGSYTVLVSDSVMLSLVIISYYFFTIKKYFPFIFISSLAVLTKEPALFFYFPLGLYMLWNRKMSKAIIVLAVLFIPVLWHLYLRFTFPNWSATRLADFIQPMEGIWNYLVSIQNALQQGGGIRELARILSRLPLLLLLCLGIWSIFTGSWSNGWYLRIGLLINFFMIFSASFYHFWSVYENISRMFTISIFLFILLQKEDQSLKAKYYFYLCGFITFLFVLRVGLIQKAQEYIIWYP